MNIPVVLLDVWDAPAGVAAVAAFLVFLKVHPQRRNGRSDVAAQVASAPL